MEKLSKMSSEDLYKMTWKQFWEGACSSPSNYLCFYLDGIHYQIRHGDYCWHIELYSGDEAFGAGEILSVKESKYGHRDYHSQENWDDMLKALYILCTTPCFGGKSFKDSIEDILFEY